MTEPSADAAIATAPASDAGPTSDAGSVASGRRPSPDEVLVIGAGPAGLATAACLQRLGLKPAVLEREAAVAPRWRKHYDRLHLHTEKRLSALPFMPWPDGTPRYPSRDQVTAYFSAFAAAQSIEPRFGVTVRRIARDGDRFSVDTSIGRLAPRCVVVATGAYAVPVRPVLPGLAGFGGPALHSSAYRNALPFVGHRALVIGCGNSGAEIALDLADHGVDVALVVRGAVHIVPREIAGVSTQALSLLMAPLPARWRDALVAPVLRLMVGDLRRFGIERPSLGPYSSHERSGRVPLLDIGTVAAIKSGRIRVRPAIDAVLSNGARFVDGAIERYDDIILATGYRPDAETLLADPADRGWARKAWTAPGIYFVGFRTPATGLLREIGREARRVAAAIAVRLGA